MINNEQIVVIVNEEKGSSSTGFVVRNDAILTACHVVPRGEDKTDIRFYNNKRTTPGHVITRSDKYDLAVVQVHVPQRILKKCTLPLRGASAFDLDIGQELYTISNPVGLWHTYLHGYLAKKPHMQVIYDRDDEGNDVEKSRNVVFVADIMAQQGSSGSPIFTVNDELVGLTIQTRKDFTVTIATPAVPFVQPLLSRYDRLTAQ